MYLRQWHSVKGINGTFWILCWYSTAFLLSSSLVCLESLSSASYRSLRRRAADRSSSSCLMVTCISSSCAWYSWQKGHRSWWWGKSKLYINFWEFTGCKTYFRNVSMYSGCSVQNRDKLLLKHHFCFKEKAVRVKIFLNTCDNLPRNIENGELCSLLT